MGIAMTTQSPNFTISLLIMIAVAAILSAPVRGSEQNAIPPARFAISSVTNTSSHTKAGFFAPTAERYVRQQRGSISGQVVLPSGHQVNTRIRITLTGYRLTPSTTYTDNKGRFSFQGISDGIYSVQVEGESNLYEPVSQEVRVIYGASSPLLITLREKAGAANRSKAGVVSVGELDEQVPDEAKKEFEKGAELSDKGKFQDAIERFKKALAILPNYLRARNSLGVQYLKLGRWAEATEQFEKAIQINPKALGPRQNIASALIEQKKYAEAIEHLNQALSIDSSSPTAHLYAGIASLGVDEIDQAERELSTALSLGGADYSNAHFYLALVYVKKGQRELAIRELNAYLEKLPKGEKAPRARQLLEKLKP
jgi:Flp pilus assembly protein TadD